MTRRFIFILIFFAAFASNALAHEVRPAYLELKQTSTDTFDVLWKTPTRGDRRLSIYVRLSEDCVNLSEPVGTLAANAHIERWSIKHPNALVGSTIHIDGLTTTKTDVIVRIQRLDGSTQTGRISHPNPSLIVDASPTWTRIASIYLALGVEHILSGIDHLLFVLALLLLVKGKRRLIETITAFTIAHSVTLALATLGVINVPIAPVESIIALSIVFVAAEVIHSRRGNPGLAERFPWIIAAIFGLLHGLGFASALSNIGLPQNAIPLSLLFFNLGVELGQLLFVAAAGLVIIAAKRYLAHPPKGTDQLLPYAIGSISMFWVIERISML